MKLIVARNKKGYIGKGGEMLWHSREDLQHFKKLTQNSVVVVGRETWERCLHETHLPNRVMLVVGKGQYGVPAPDFWASEEGDDYYTLPDAMAAAMAAELTSDMEREMGFSICPYKSAWVIGGKQIYDHFVHFCDEVHMSLINDDSEGDVMWDVPADYRGKVYYYEFEPDRPQLNLDVPPED